MQTFLPCFFRSEIHAPEENDLKEMGPPKLPTWKLTTLIAPPYDARRENRYPLRGSSVSRVMGMSQKKCSRLLPTQQKSSMASPPPQPCFVTKEIPGKGTGVVAVEDIQPGQLIIAEPPLFVVPWWVRHSLYPG